jgi:rubrerythrin
MDDYVCLNCRYRFKAGEKPKACPWCSKSGSVEQERSAEDIVNEVEKLLE